MSTPKKTKHLNAFLQALGPLEKIDSYAEIGVARGWLARQMAERFEIRRIVLVDPWKDCWPWDPPRQEQWYEETKSWADSYRAATGREVTIHKMRSLEAAELVADASLEVVHIDADHSYESCREDILAWWPKVKPGGWLTGDNFNAEGVERAVKELVPGYKVELDLVWWLRL